jgi:hypothetical protein
MSTGDIGYKDRIEYLDDDGVTWVPVYQVRSITLPKKSNNRVDFSHLESPSRTKEYKLGFGEWSACQCEAVYDYSNASQGKILTDADAGTQRSWRIRLRDSSTEVVQETWQFTGSVGEAGLSQATNEDPRMLSFSVNVDGAVTIS